MTAMSAEHQYSDNDAASRIVLNHFLSHREEIIPEINRILRMKAFENRFILHPKRLKEIGTEEFDRFTDFLKHNDEKNAEDHGGARAGEGLGEDSLLSMGMVFRDIVLKRTGELERETLALGIGAVDRYIFSIMRGYIRARENIILKAQEQLRVALSTALETQRRELHIKNHAIHTYINGIMITDIEGAITYVNPAFIKMWKFAETENVIGKQGARFLGIDSFDVLNRHLSMNSGWQKEYSAVREDGSTFDVDISVSRIHDNDYKPIGIMVSFVDITGRKRLEVQFRQSQKMEALGQLAGGIVHDFNNLLQVISGFTELELRKIQKESREYKNISQIKVAADRGKDLTAQLRYFTRQASGKHRPVNINTIISETHALLKRTFPPEIRITLELDPNLRMVEADPSQISQMLLNLCVNARDAVLIKKEPDDSKHVPGEPLGTITLYTENVKLDLESASRFINTQPGDYVCLRIGDTGSGMTPEVKERLFEPFFTTKGEKSGTGLGLAVVYGIVQKHTGFIDVKSIPGEGSTFEIYLPIVEIDIKSAVREDHHKTPQGGRGTILIVEDQPQVRELAVNALENSGFKVITAKDGLTGVEKYKEHYPAVDLVVLDVIMPRMGGRECFNKLKEINPEIKVLIITGYTADESVQELLKEGAVGLIEKPFDLDDFTETVRRRISSDRTPAGPPTSP